MQLSLNCFVMVRETAYIKEWRRTSRSTSRFSYDLLIDRQSCAKGAELPIALSVINNVGI